MIIRRRNGGYSAIKVPEEMLDELKKFQKTNSELKALSIDDLVALAVVTYLRKNLSQEHSL